jgi:hypothetical protein
MRLRDNFEIGAEELPGEVDLSASQAQPKQYFFDDGGSATVGQPMPGSGRPADQVELQSTDIAPYMRDPGLAKAQADVTKARYGGSSIQDSAAAEAAAQKGQPGQAEIPGQPGQPQYDRRRFESVVFQNMGGNPFEIDVVLEVDKLTAESLPQLFNQVFKGQAIWEDRGRLSKKQQAFWQDELKRYRAHVKDRVTSDRKTKIDYYNFMMKNFDNESKEHEARIKRQQAQSKGTTADAKDMRKRMDDLQKTKRDILKRQGEIMQKATQAGASEVPEEFEAEFLELAEQLKFINQEAHNILMKTDQNYRLKKTLPNETVASHSNAPKAADLVAPKPADQPKVVTGKLPSQPPESSKADTPSSRIPKVEPKKPKETVEGQEFKYKPHPKGKPVAVRRDERTGRLVGKMEDGSFVWLDELKG